MIAARTIFLEDRLGCLSKDHGPSGVFGFGVVLALFVAGGVGVIGGACSGLSWDMWSDRRRGVG